MSGITITELTAERFKRLKAVRLEPTEKGLTIIGGGNAHGKTSVLDAIAYALGGAKFKPSSPDNRDGEGPASITVKLSNGLVVERSGLKGTLKVTDATGLRGTQGILDEFIEQLALDLPKFLEASGKQKAETLLQIIGVGEELHNLDIQEKRAYEGRRAVKRESDAANKATDAMEKFPDCLGEVSQDEIRAELEKANAAVAKKAKMAHEYEVNLAEQERMVKRVVSLRQEADDLQLAFDALGRQNNLAKAAYDKFEVPNVDDVMQRLQAAEDINRQYRANLAFAQSCDKCSGLSLEVKGLTEEIEAVRANRQKLLDEADMPLPELSVVDGELEYKGAKWDCMSSAEQLKVATAIVRKLQPKCGFVLIDKLERMDMDTLKEFGEWAETEGLQIIATRVSIGEECSVVIDEGTIAG